MQERLQKIIARAGLTSRRKAEELIREGRISVNGQIVTELGTKADVAKDRVSVDGKPVGNQIAPVYLLFHKPRGVVSTLSDPEGRSHIGQFLRTIRQRLYPVGRLDYNSEGLMLLTNDGELAHRVMHASSELPKTYWVKVAQRPSEAELARLRAGIALDGRRTAPAEIRWLKAADPGLRKLGVRRTSTENPWLEVVLIEGRKNQIRRMFASLGHPVEKLKRVGIGFLQLGALRPGEMRTLSASELSRLRRAVGLFPSAEREMRDNRRHQRTG